MEVRYVDRKPASKLIFDSHSAGLISALGTPDFEPRFMLLARELCNCDHVTVFLTSEGSAPQVVLAANHGPSQVAHDVAKKYVSHYWHLDPVRRVASQRKSTALVQVETLEIDHSDYRRDCYKSVGLDRRLSIVKQHANVSVQINVYGKYRNDRLSDGMLELAPEVHTLVALVLKHRDLGALDPSNLACTSRRRLRLVCPKLPARETEVCVLIASGMSSEAIAIELGISVNTVLTYRKRSYTRLGITSHNELMRLVMGRLD
jgi:DNA-binding CsgD family transcriptional regulator